MIRSLMPVLLLCLFAACEEPDVVSSEVIPGTDQPGVFFTDTLTIGVSTVREDSLIGSNATLPLFLGSLNDQTIGISTASLYIQMRLSSTPFPDFAGLATPDSVVLTLGYSANYGDTAATHHISVYRMEELLHADSVYYTNRDFQLTTPGIPLGSGSIVPHLNDSVEINGIMQPPHLRLKLNNSFGELIMTEYLNNSGSFSSHESFYNFFKGIYIRDSVDYTGAGDVTGSMLTFDAASSYNTITIYYSDSLSRVFTLNSSSARNVRFQHSYNTNIFSDNTQFLVQSMAGLKTKIEIPNLSGINSAHPVSINKAEVVVSLKSGSTSVIPNHSSMIVFAADSAGRNTLVADFFETSNYVSGLFDGTHYKFNISRHVQKILNGELKNYGFYLVGGGSVSNANRTILEGNGSVKFNLTYTLQNN